MACCNTMAMRSKTAWGAGWGGGVLCEITRRLYLPGTHQQPNALDLICLQVLIIPFQGAAAASSKAKLPVPTAQKTHCFSIASTSPSLLLNEAVCLIASYGSEEMTSRVSAVCYLCLTPFRPTVEPCSCLRHRKCLETSRTSSEFQALHCAFGYPCCMADPSHSYDNCAAILSLRSLKTDSRRC
jgi:hypothetical protein